MINFCEFAAGRIGAIHAGNISRHPDAQLKIIVDPDRAAAERLAERYGAAVDVEVQALADPAIDAVVIASSTDTHAALVEAAAHAGKAVFCEKPLDLDRRQISNSRRAAYGYDQRIEAFGSKGALRAENVAGSTVSFAGANGILGDRPVHFFLERYCRGLPPRARPFHRGDCERRGAAGRRR